MSRTWSLEELAEESQRYLDDDGGESKRVRWKPSARQIRYYSTLGLLDKPDTENGRVVWYGPKHLLQLLAIKRLQQEGMKLAAIQRTLTGATAEEMRGLVGLPESFLDDLQNGDKQAPSLNPRRETPFWATRPAPPKADSGPLFERPWRLRIGPGVTLILDEKQASGLSDKEREDLARALIQTWREQQERRTKENP
jgi:DNA-binding transcriptional MerR regulator